MMQTGTERDSMPPLATESSQSALLQAPEQGSLAPWLEGASDSIPCTPPPQLLSPQPLTPKPTRFVSPPRTPLPKLFTSLTPRAIRQWEAAEGAGNTAATISRPESACSNYSSSSDSSLDSLTTFTTAGGSCTSPETEASFFADEPEKETVHLKPTDAPRWSSKVQDGTGEKDGASQIRVRRTKWSEEMDNHLWRTYIIYQQDPKITPFYVLPGQVPPLGVCCKVARETKRSWKVAKMGDGWKGVPSTPRPKRKSRVSGYKTASDTAATGNRGDILRKTSPYSWPASEASTRRRLRELCRDSYGPSINPHREYRQQRRTTSTPRLLPPRSSTASPSPLNSATSDRLGSRDSFLFSTRSIALSLTTSTASTMNPNGLLAAIASGYDVEPGMAAGFGSGSFNFGGVPESVSGVNRCNNSVSGRSEGSQLQQTGNEMEQGSPVRHETDNGPSGSSDGGPSGLGGLLPPLELNSSSSSYGTWPRRLKRQEILPDFSEDAVVFPPPRRARRGTIGDLFGNPIPSSPTTTPATTNASAMSTATNTTVRSARSRGFTIGASFGSSLTSRRRYRPSAPLLTVTGPVSYDSPNDSEMLSPLAARHSSLDTIKSDDPFELPRRLGSPFLERKDWKGGEAEDLEEKSGPDSPLDGEFGDFLGLRSDVGITTGRSTPTRPIKRARE
ncbi:unnamed protein product [Tuber aestivum]|uniref:Uncharacterized protein n=1 Tax=Tuber aestivum TaxID=59557 RepID=A0A292PZN8_9PEZI|nr:unnamed protein product [Tuber aestivum]